IETVRVNNPEEEIADVERFASGISSALDGYAHSGGVWMHGKQVFEDVLERGDRVDAALYAALESVGEQTESSPEVAASRFWDELPVDAAISEALSGYAHDGDTWLRGKAVFLQQLEEGVR